MTEYATWAYWKNVLKRTYTYNGLQFPAEMNTGSTKTPTTFIPFYTNYCYKGRLSINKDFMFSSLHNTML